MSHHFCCWGKLYAWIRLSMAVWGIKLVLHPGMNTPHLIFWNTYIANKTLQFVGLILRFDRFYNRIAPGRARRDAHQWKRFERNRAKQPTAAHPARQIPTVQRACFFTQSREEKLRTLGGVRTWQTIDSHQTQCKCVRNWAESRISEGYEKERQKHTRCEWAPAWQMSPIRTSHGTDKSAVRLRKFSTTYYSFLLEIELYHSSLTGLSISIIAQICQT